MQHVRDQNWMAVVIDIVVVCGSVLLATQISIGLEKDREQRELRSAMKHISGELNASRDNMRWMSDRYRDDMAALRQILAVLDSESAPELAQADLSRGLLAMFYPRTLFIQYDLISELQHSDGLRSIPQDDLHGALRELTARYHELETIQAMRQPLAMGSRLTDFPFVRATVEQDLESRAWGSLMVADIDWVEARRSPAFHNAVAQSHSYIRSLLTNLEVAKVMATESARLMHLYGYSPETTWYETIGEPLEQEVSKNLIKLLTEGSD